MENIKAIVAPRTLDEWIIPHALARETGTNWEARLRREKARPSDYGDTSVFTLNGVHYVVGNEAMSSGELTRVVGTAKYTAGYFDALVNAAFLKMWPQGHNNVVLFCAHSVNSLPYFDKIKEAVGKRHVATKTDGTTVKYAVRAMVGWDEPAGGLWRFARANDNLRKVSVGSRICVVDIGGKISSMYVAEVLPDSRLQIYWNDGLAMNLGVQNFTEKLSTELPNLYPDTFQDMLSIPEQMLRDCLRNKGMMKIKGDTFDASQAYMNATGILMDSLVNTWRTKMSGGANVDLVVVTGGGGGAMFLPIVEDFNHKHIYLADDINAIELANLRGGLTIATAWYAANHKTLATASDGTRPAIAVIDAGNSGIKFTKFGGV